MHEILLLRIDGQSEALPASENWLKNLSNGSVPNIDKLFE